MKRTVQQSVFESKDAIRAAKAGHKLACDELNATPRHLLNEGNPNHPMYDAIWRVNTRLPNHEPPQPAIQKRLK